MKLTIIILLAALTANAQKLTNTLTASDSTAPTFRARALFTAMAWNLSDSLFCHVCRRAFVEGDDFIYRVTKLKNEQRAKSPYELRLGGYNGEAQFIHLDCAIIERLKR